MKKFLLPLLGLLLPLGAALAQSSPSLEAAAVLISSPAIDHQTTIEVAFPREMVAESAIGQQVDPAPAKISPAWAGKWTWSSPRVARFTPTEGPKLGATYVFTPRSGMKDPGGNRIPVAGEVSVKVPRLAIITKSTPEIPEDKAINERQTPQLFLFNAPVAAESLKNTLAFRDRAGNVRAAAWRFACWRELSVASRGHLPLKDRVLKQCPSLSEDEIPNRPLDSTIPWALVVQPAEPLPAGQDWQVLLDANIAADDGSKSTLGKATAFNWGTVLPGRVTGIEAYAPVDGTNELTINFDKRVKDPGDTIWKFVRITPALPKPPKVTTNGRSISIESEDFRFGVVYTVEFTPGLPAEDGLPIAIGIKENDTDVAKRVFEANRPSVALPSTTEVQLPNGRGKYPVSHVNVRQLQIRVKEIPAALVADTLKAYANYTSGMGDEGSGRRYGYPLAWDLVPGTVIHDETITLDPKPKINKSGEHVLDWQQILKGKRPAALFIQIDGLRPLGNQNSSRAAMAQSLVQLSDIGLAWKNGDTDLLVYAFSHTSGEPAADTEITVRDAKGAQLLAGRTDATGLARFAKPATATQLVARRGSDSHTLDLNLDDPNYSPWRLGAGYYDWRTPSPDKRSVFLFSDRSLYRPGETIHLAGFARDYKGNLPKLPAGTKATLTFFDDDNRSFHTEDITFGSCGQFAVSTALPAAKVGFFRAEVKLPALETKPAEAARPANTEDSGDDGEENANEDDPTRDLTKERAFSHYFQVQEFRRNTFELAMPMADELIAPEEIKSQLVGTYYLGAPVAKGDVRWSAHFSAQGFYPEKWRDYLFADHREFDGGYWSHYYGIDYYYAPQRATAYLNGEAKLDAAGTTQLAIAVPADTTFPMPRTAFVTAEVTDPNQQTLSVQHQVMLHPADFYLGLKRPPELVRAGDTVTIDAIAVKPDGSRVSTPVAATIRVEKQIWNTVEVQAAGGGIVKRNEARMEPVSTAQLAITGEPSTAPLAFPETGVYHVTLEAKDGRNHVVRTTVAITVEGKEYYAWEGMEGVRVDLLPDKKLYQAGDTARLLVKTPISGTALVTVEREGIERAFITRLSGSSPVIEVPLTDLDAPNTHVGVMIIEGTAGSRMKFPLPRAKFGYTKLIVEQRLAKLDVAVQPSRASVRPGADATVEIKTTDHSGKPVANAAVVFYAVDEGELAVMGYENPLPVNFFHPNRSLRVRTSASLPNLLAEDPEEISGYNKGYVIGGGGEGEQNVKPRSDFTPCAHFTARLKTDATGMASVTFKTPDTLTRYRLIAVAAAPDGWRFGTGVQALEVTKPLMLEPSAPRFGHVGDTMVVRALLLNQSPADGVFSVVLQPDSRTTLEGTPRTEIAVAAGKSATVEYTVKFAGVGKTTWLWQATPVRFDTPIAPDLEAEMKDAVQSSFDIEHPIPILREWFAARLHPEAREAGLIDQASPNLRAGEGEIRVTVANTRMVDGLGAMRQLLHYPYGCVEQTSSGLMPWLAAHNMREFLPEPPSAEEITKAVNIAVSRLSSMQTDAGGLGYWPGADTPDFWGSVHAARVLLMARQAEHNVPAGLLDPLLAYVKTELPGMMEDQSPWMRADRASALQVLAMAGTPDLAFMNRLFDDRDKLDLSSRLHLALAFCAAPDGKEKAIQLLGMPMVADKQAWPYWYPQNQLLSLRLQAMAAAGMDRSAVDPVLDELIATRTRDGDWGSTYTNSGALVALATYHRTYEKNFGASKVVVSWEGKSKEIVLDAKPGKQSITIGLNELTAISRPIVQLAEGTSPAYITTELAARPAEMPRKRASAVFGIERRYRKVQPDGSLVARESFKVGDMVAVTLDVRSSEGRRYIAIDDPLPATMEAVNPEFTSQGGNELAMAYARVWSSDHTELRTSRALFFCNHLSNPGSYTLTYLARVTKAGQVFAPPSKIEAMYDPSLTALGEGGMFRTMP